MSNFVSQTRLIIHFLKNNFNSKRASAICLFIAWLNKSIIACLHTNLIADKSLYLLFSKSILQGHSALEPIHLLGAAKPQYVFVSAIISPFYSIIALPFLWLTHSFITTSIILDAISWSIFFSGLYVTAKEFLKDRWIVNSLILCVGFFVFVYELGSSPKDTFAIGFILWATYLTYKHVTEKPVWKRSFFLWLVYILIVFTKLLYAPLILVFLFFIFLFSFKRRSSLLNLHSVIISIACLAIFFIFFQYFTFLKIHYADTVSFVHSSFGKQGFYPKNLLNTYPFISSSIINTNFWCVLLANLFHRPFSWFYNFFQLADVVLFPFLIFCLVNIFIKSLPQQKNLLLFSLISLAILLMVCLMSVRYGPAYFYYGSNGWTYVQEPRSFLYIMIFLQIFFFYLFFKSDLLNPVIKKFLFLLFLIECAHGLYFTIKQVSDRSTEIVINKTEKKIFSIYNEMQKQSSQHVCLLTSNEILRRYASISNIDAYAFPKSYNPAAKDSTVYLSVTYPSDSGLLKQYFKNRNIVFLDSVQPYVVNIIK